MLDSSTIISHTFVASDVSHGIVELCHCGLAFVGDMDFVGLAKQDC
jgi:hypothetical protein